MVYSFNPLSIEEYREGLNRIRENPNSYFHKYYSPICLGSITRPTKRIVPVVISLIANKKG